MSKGKGLLITDLDNTLYDWVTFFARSFQSMLSSLANLVRIPEEILADEFRSVHRRYGTSEQPFAILELPSVRSRFPGLERRALLKELDEPLHVFNRTRKETLRLYESVEITLRTLREAGFDVVGHSESSRLNAYYRLTWLGIDGYFSRLYVQAVDWRGHPVTEREADLRPPKDLIREIPRSERKPNPALLRDICEREGHPLGKTWYVGDSLIRDVSMAKTAGVRAIWARYGTRYDKHLWDILVRITHWTEADVQREEQLRRRFDQIDPDYVIDSYAQLLPILGVGSGRALSDSGRPEQTSK